MISTLIFIGPPGSGKGTQAEMFAEKYDMYHLESSKELEARFQDAPEDDQEMVREREIWKRGDLNTPSFVTKVISGKIKELHEQGKKIVFSGSPRTLYEAERLIPLLEELFGKANIFVIQLLMSDNESVKRNSGRRMCEKERHPIPNFPENKDLTTCPKDGSKLVTRALDKPDVIQERLKEYHERTQPIIAFYLKSSYTVFGINAEQSIENVKDDIEQVLKARLS